MDAEVERLNSSTLFNVVSLEKRPYLYHLVDEKHVGIKN